MAKTLKEKVLETLRAYGSLSRTSLRHLVGVDQRGDRWMRTMIERLRDEGHDIGSSAKRGYFMIVTEKDHAEALREFKSRHGSMLKRYKQLVELGERKFSKQLEIPLEGTG